MSVESHNLRFLVPHRNPDSGERVYRGCTKCDFHSRRGKETAETLLAMKKIGKHRRRRVECYEYDNKKTLVLIFLMCHPG